jgi:hypothetical protein
MVRHPIRWIGEMRPIRAGLEVTFDGGFTMTTSHVCRLSLLMVISLRGSVSAENWPAWRGLRGDGTCTEQGLPTTWSKSENVAWKVPLPERGNSTPIVWKDRVFVTQAVEKEGRRTLMCFDRQDGRLLWQQGTEWHETEPTHGTNPMCSASPVTDGERVVAWFGSAGTYKHLWCIGGKK